MEEEKIMSANNNRNVNMAFLQLALSILSTKYLYFKELFTDFT